MLSVVFVETIFPVASLVTSMDFWYWVATQPDRSSNADRKNIDVSCSDLLVICSFFYGDWFD